MPSRFSMSVQCNLRHYSYFPEKDTESSTFKPCFYLHFSVVSPELPLSRISCKIKSSDILSKSLLSFIPWRVHKHLCSAFLLHYTLIRNIVFSLQNLLWERKFESVKEQSASTEITSSCWLSLNWSQEATGIKGFSSLRVRSCAAAAHRKAEGTGWNEGVSP